MNPFTYVAADSAASALHEIGPGNQGSAGKFLAGGTNLIDLMKANLIRPTRLVDINRIGLDQIEPGPNGSLMLGALARNADTAYHSLVRNDYPLVTAAILAGASAQIRNLATNGGNLLQRTRCYYFYDAAVPCNKRVPGSGCPAMGGLTRQHAILGASEHCIATHPSDLCVALAALDATVHVTSSNGPRTIRLVDLHRLPGDRPDLDTILAPNELITHIELPLSARFAAHSAYLKLRDRASYAFALVSVAAALDLEQDGTIGDVRVALGGVAHKPWRLPEAEMLLVGQAADATSFGRLAEALLSGARGQGDNDFKITMARRAIVRALQVAKAGTRDNTGCATAAHSPEPDAIDSAGSSGLAAPDREF